MIDGTQVRCARALLDWPASRLADRTGLTINAINRIERGKTVPQKSTVEKIQLVFEHEGIEFLPNSGLRKRDRWITIFEGPDFKERLLHDIADSIKDGVREVSIAHEPDTKVPQEIEKLCEHTKKSKKFKDDVVFKVMNRSQLLQTDLNLPTNLQSFLPSYPLYIYGSKLALCAEDFSFRAIIIDNNRIADSLRNMFRYIWDHTAPPPPSHSLRKTQNSSRQT